MSTMESISAIYDTTKLATSQEKKPVQLPLFDALVDFEQRLPYRSLCSDTKRYEPTHILPKARAKLFPYVQVNYPGIDYLCFDLDYPGAHIASEEKDLPCPTLTVITPESQHAHLLYELLYPLPRKHSKATRSTLKDVIFCYKEMLCADKVITTQKQLVKNALSSKWEVITGHKPFTLTELAEAIPGDFRRERAFTPHTHQALSIKPFSETLQPYSRNCSLFENARYFAYATVQEHGSQESFYQAILERIVSLNNEEIPKYFPVKIKAISELRSIARSVSRWVWERRSQFRVVNAGAMGFTSMKGTYWKPGDYDREVKYRRVKAAQRSHEIQKQATRQKIQYGIDMCLKHGIDVTVANIASLGQVSRKSVYNHKDILDNLSEMVFG